MRTLDTVSFQTFKFSINTIILIEHDMSLVMKLCDKIFVFDYGHLIAEGDPESIQCNEQVLKAYLGGDYVAEAK